MHLSGVSSHHHSCTFFYPVFCGWGKSICWIGGDARFPSHGGFPRTTARGRVWDPGSTALGTKLGFVIALLHDLPK